LKAAASRKKTKGSVRSTARRAAAKPKGRSAAKLSTSKKRTATSRKRTVTRKTRAATSKKKAPTSKKKAATTKKSVRVAAKTTKRPRAPVRQARTSTPARATHPKAAPTQRARIPSPLPTRHVAPERGPLAVRARSMPPTRDKRHPLTTPAHSRPPVALPEFSEAGVFLAITYSIRDGRRGEFFDLMRELKPLLTAIGGMDVCVYEDRSRPNYLMEVFRFRDEAEFTAFDDKFHKDRKIAAIYALLDDIVEAEKSDFKIFERRL